MCTEYCVHSTGVRALQAASNDGIEGGEDDDDEDDEDRVEVVLLGPPTPAESSLERREAAVGQRSSGDPKAMGQVMCSGEDGGGAKKSKCIWLFRDRPLNGGPADFPSAEAPPDDVLRLGEPGTAWAENGLSYVSEAISTVRPASWSNARKVLNFSSGTGPAFRTRTCRARKRRWLFAREGVR